jgi:hypothetical protein
VELEKRKLTLPFFGAGAIELGCDPEFFFADGRGSVKGAEKFLPKNGLEAGSGKIIIDGVQAELNPTPSDCRQILKSNIRECLKKVAERAKAKGIKVNFKGVVKVHQKEMDSLSDKSKEFGCAKSKNAYMSERKAKIKVNPKVYNYRSAGGHIHLGDYGNTYMLKTLHNTPVLVPLLDLIVGNTCVLIDRDPLTKERRKNYGRAGEFRTPVYGIEYRTLSNFWLRSYQLMSFVMGLARFAVGIVYNSYKAQPFAEILLKKTKQDDVVKAINTNNLRLAKKNFEVLEWFIREYIPSNASDVPINANNLPAFKYFVEKGINHWFKKDILDHWINERHIRGWERFLNEIVKPEYAKTLPIPKRTLKKINK